MLLEKHLFLKKNSSKLVFLFIASFLCTPMMNDANRINFVWGKQKSVKKIISPKFNFFSMVGPLYSHWQQCPLRNFLIKESFHRICFRNTSFYYSDHFLCPIDPLLQTFQKFFQREMFSVKRKVCKKELFFSIFGTLYSHS